MTSPDSPGASWSFERSSPAVHVRFLGRGWPAESDRIVGALGSVDFEVARCRQIHSADVLDARAGDCGPGDALVTDRSRLALAVVTADCVPVILAGRRQLAAVHAGWRGIAGRIVPRTLTRFREPSEVTAWLGPAIGPCCYEVGDDVATRVTAVSSPSAASRAPTGRPHLDLHRAVTEQLREGGVERIEAVSLCTRCEERKLWSYRREGTGAGRNWTLAWKASDEPAGSG